MRASAPRTGARCSSRAWCPLRSGDDPRLGTKLWDRYEIRRVVADGGMGRVYEGIDKQTQTRIAVKVLHAEVAKDEVSLERFKREYEISERAPARSHREGPRLPAGPRAGGVAAGDGVPRRRGASLRAQAREDDPAGAPRPDARARRHRPRRSARAPGRSSRPEAGQPVPCAARARVTSSRSSTSDRSRTRTRTRRSSPSSARRSARRYYMAPEQAQGLETLDARADVFALAAITYECMTGTVPFTGNNGPSILLSILTKDPDPPSTKSAGAKYPIPAAMDDGDGGRARKEPEHPHAVGRRSGDGGRSRLRARGRSSRLGEAASGRAAEARRRRGSHAPAPRPPPALEAAADPFAAPAVGPSGTSPMAQPQAYPGSPTAAAAAPSHPYGQGQLQQHAQRTAPSTATGAIPGLGGRPRVAHPGGRGPRGARCWWRPRHPLRTLIAPVTRARSRRSRNTRTCCVTARELREVRLTGSRSPGGSMDPGAGRCHPLMAGGLGNSLPWCGREPCAPCSYHSERSVVFCSGRMLLSKKALVLLVQRLHWIERPQDLRRIMLPFTKRPGRGGDDDVITKDDLVQSSPSSEGGNQPRM